jgi:hypothetical protein
VDAFENLFIAGVGGGSRGDPRFTPSGVRKVDTNGIIVTIPGATGEAGSFIGLATDASSNLFVASQGQIESKVRKVDANGQVSTVAGRAEEDGLAGHGYSGDGGPAAIAELRGPSGAAVDGAGNLFIADEFNDRVRKVSTKGIITTVAGNGRQGYSRDGRRAIHTQLDYPCGVAVDASGNLFIAEDGRGKRLIRKVNPMGIITVVAGGGSNRISDGLAATNVDLDIVSGGLAVDGFGNLFFSTLHQIRKVGTNGIITTVAGDSRQGCSGEGGPATSASLGLSRELALDRFGNLFIADDYCGRIRKVGNTQGPALVLHNASAVDSGGYRVVVTGAGGNVTSSVATLDVKPMP